MTLYERTVAAGGGTFHADGTPVGPTRAHRFAVATSNGTAVRVPVSDRVAFDLAVAGIASPVVGTWVHKGEIHVDPVVVVGHPVQALRLGRACPQIAIYDLIADKEITL
jgi:hypothetical protein